MTQTTPTTDGGPSLAERARTREIVGVELAEVLAGETDLAGIDLTGADLRGADLSGLKMFKAKLRGASLRNANLSGAELSGADLEGADLEGAQMIGTGLGMANLRKSRAFNADFTDATLTRADLSGADFGCAKLIGARLREATLASTSFRSSDLRRAELSLCRVTQTCFDDADLRGARLRAVTDFQSAQWYGVDIRDINFAGAYQLRRYVIDENYLREFRESGRLQRGLYRVWWLTSDCGRSLGRWLVVILAVAAVFTALFAVVGVRINEYDPGIVTYLYYSVVTLTTLGYGDIVPNSTLGQILVIVEVCIGYMMLGGLISIFANKLARRGG
jgi:uncharacterized protein YjbI with pentapeptide repeats